MNLEAFHQYCLQKKMSEESFPFDEDHLVFKVLGKIFAITDLSGLTATANLKCNPAYAQELRQAYPEDVLPGWHMNKKHWNTVRLEGSLPDAMIIKLIDHSYEQVIAGLPKHQRLLLS
jgi:predicted DNA-binding protein (MmcQ/YjbR family)